jgi:hypothetical protein
MWTLTAEVPVFLHDVWSAVVPRLVEYATRVPAAL